MDVVELNCKYSVDDFELLFRVAIIDLLSTVRGLVELIEVILILI